MRLFSLLLVFSSFSLFAASPKLIVQITVDQLRADLPPRYQKHFISSPEKAGFNRFLQQGVRYENNHYRHASTKTAVGHATLATGALPSQHGVIGNNWFDQPNNANMYCVGDNSTKLLNEDGYSASPKNLQASTFSDELFIATNGQAKIYAVSTKDRGAVLTAGRYGKAFWYNKTTGNMVTSNYYYPQQPQWLDTFNQSGAKDQFLGVQWQLSKPVKDYINNSQNRLFQIPPKGFSKGFPHQLSDKPAKAYYQSLSYTPFGDQLTAQMAKNLVSQHKLGQDNVTDYLSVSFSVNDYVGHQFGPYSREAEENLIQLDRTLSDLFQFLDKEIGLEHVLLALSADHGVDAIPEYKKSLGFAALRGNAVSKIKQLEKAAKTHFKTDKPLITSIKLPNIYFARQNIQQAGLNSEEVYQWFAERIQKLDSVADVIHASQLQGQKFSDPILTKVQNSFYAERSGQLIMVQKNSALFGGGSSAASHGSPYSYDTHVPLYFAGMSLKPAEYFQLTSPEDLAVTLSAMLKIPFPDKATGKVLKEVIQ